MLKSSGLEPKKALSTMGEFVETCKPQTTHIYFNLELLLRLATVVDMLLFAEV